MAEVQQFPSNSHADKSREAKPPVKRREMKQVATAKRAKKTVGQKLTEAFIGDDSDKDSIFDYIVYDVLVPAAKNMLFDAIQGGVSMALFGSDRANGSRSANFNSRPGSYTNYSTYSSSRPTNAERDTRVMRRSAREKIYNDDLIFQTRQEAYEVVDQLNDAIDDYGEVSLAELYVLTGIDSDPTDNAYGWKNLDNYTVKPVRDGFRLILPPAYSLDNGPRRRQR